MKIIGRIEKTYQLDEGYEILHKDIKNIVESLNGKLKDIILKNIDNKFLLEIFTEGTHLNSRKTILNKLKNFNQEIIYMYKRGKLIIKLYEK